LLLRNLPRGITLPGTNFSLDDGDPTDRIRGATDKEV
jgi:hypothetical protein